MIKLEMPKSALVKLVTSTSPNSDAIKDLVNQELGIIFTGKMGGIISFAWNERKLSELSEQELVDLYNRYYFYYDEHWNYCKDEDIKLLS